jgi:hypothetical protein
VLQICSDPFSQPTACCAGPAHPRLAVSVLLVCAASCCGQHPQCPNKVYIVCAGNLLVTCMPLCWVLGAVGSWWQSSCLVCATVLPYPVLQAGRRFLFGCLARGGNELFDSERSLKEKGWCAGHIACMQILWAFAACALTTHKHKPVATADLFVCLAGFYLSRAGCLVSLHLVVGSLLLGKVPFEGGSSWV